MWDDYGQEGAYTLLIIGYICASTRLELVQSGFLLSIFVSLCQHPSTGGTGCRSPPINLNFKNSD